MRHRARVVRAVQERLQAVLWNGTVGSAPIRHEPAAGLALVPVADMAPSRVVVAWRTGGASPQVREFARIAREVYRG